MNKNYVIVLSFSLFLTACGQKKEDKEAIIRPVKTAIVESRSEIKKRLFRHCRSCRLRKTRIPREWTNHQPTGY